MSSHSVDTSTVSTRTRSSEQGKEGWRGILTGLIPLGLYQWIVMLADPTSIAQALERMLFGRRERASRSIPYANRIRYHE
jgi:hypothetical protein